MTDESEPQGKVSWLTARFMVPAEAVDILRRHLVPMDGLRPLPGPGPSWDDCAYALGETLTFLVEEDVITFKEDVG